MPRPAAPSSHPIARVRAWFGLHLTELALYLGVSKSLLHKQETGQQPLSPAVSEALLPLLRQVPPAEAPPEEAAVTFAAADAVELAFRRRQCLAQAARLRRDLAKLLVQAQAAQHWAQALPALLPPPGAPMPADADAATREAWRVDWLHRRARPLPPDVATRAALLRARLLGLTAEAAALATEVPITPPNDLAAC